MIKLVRRWKNRKPQILLKGVENSAAMWETSVAVLQNVNTEWPRDAAFPPLGIYLKAVKVSVQPNIHRSSIHNRQK